MKYFVLLPNRMVAEVGMLEWAQWFQTEERVVGYTETELHVISTVFLGMDHRFCGVGPPILFETMVFAKVGENVEATDLMWRYSSWDDAEAGHNATVKSSLKMEADARLAWHV